MTRRIAKAEVIAGFMTILASSLAPRHAYADATPTADTTNLTPPEAAPPPPPSTSVPAASASSGLLQTSGEVLPGQHPSRLAAYIFGGVAVVGVGVGTVFGILSLNNQSNYNSHPTYTNVSNGNQEAVISDAALGAAVIAGVTSVVLFLRKDPPPDALPVAASAAGAVRPADAVSFTVAPIVSQHGGGAGALLRF